MQVFPFSDSVVEMLAKPTVRLVHAAELHFKDGVARAHTGVGPLVIDGQTYEGVGNFSAVSRAREQLDSGSPSSVTLTLSGLDAPTVAATLQDRCRGRFGKLMVVAYDEDGTYAADILFSGKMDAANLSYGGSEDDNAISVTITDRMVDWQRGGTERWTDENHRSRHQDDRFFFAVAQLSDWPIYWGAKRDAPNFTYR
ncbi:hypothetical protein [Halomonas sp. Cn5-12]|uniref:hypothetical protein n=1 Tax=Halomonas sp. Cn5-12 TaxID=2908885 RepID=UPI001F44FF1E|nr:hypothetical protein [Halomonas sp. Cn5-12]MCF2913377.1 hypothetical protein [Halomonas sp. Cn5-12]